MTYETGGTETGRIRSPQLGALAPPGMAFAYDTIAEVLRLRYVDLKQREEVRAELAMRKVAISTGSVSNLSRVGLACLEQIHEAAAATLGRRYRQNVFIAHLDGTHEGGQWCHFVVREGMTGNMLLARKIRSEHAEDIAPILRRLKELFGVPDVLISDMSEAICNAVEAVFPTVPHRLCHYHFLKAAGTAILGAEHDSLGYGVRNRRKELNKLRRECVARQREGDQHQRWVISLIDRINAYGKDLSAEGFPFDLPYVKYIERCRAVLARVESLMSSKDLCVSIGDPTFEHLNRLRNLLRHYTESRAGSNLRTIERLNNQFARLRQILHPVAEDSHAPLNWGRIEAPLRVADIAGKLAAFREEARRMNARKSLCPSDRKMWKALHRQMEKYADKLNPLLEVRGQLFVLPRTNNISETGFRDLKRRQRRTTGNRDLQRQLDHMPPQVFYTENLADTDYCKILLGDMAMHERFAETDWNAVKEAVAAMKSPRRLGTVDHALINSDTFFEAVADALTKDPRAAAA